MSRSHEFTVHDDGAAEAELTPPTATSTSRLTLDFLAFVASRPRTYAETMEAWRTHCPRFTIWEDAIADGLVRMESGNGMTLSKTRVVLTPRGRAMLDVP